MVRKMAYIGSFWLIGLFAASFLSFSLNFAVSAFVFVSAASFLAIYRTKYVKYSVCALSFAAAMFLYGMYDCFIYRNIVKYDGSDVEVIGTITGYADHSGDKASYTIKGVINGDVKATVTCYADSISAGVGDDIKIIGKAAVFTDSYTFPAASYYKSKGIFLQINSVRKLNYYINDGFSPTKLADSYREHIINVINSNLDGREQAIMAAMLFGDRSDLEDSDKTLMTRAGIGHIMAVSGVHLAVVCSLFYFFISRLPIPKYIRLGMMLVPIFCFMLLAGMSPSVVRSAIMTVIVYGAEFFRRRADTFNSLGIAVILLTAADPFAVKDPSFLLSAAGVFGAGVAAPAVIKFLEKKHSLSNAAKAVIIPLCVNAVIFPAAVMFFDEFSVIAPVTNLLLIPICELILILGIAVTVTGGVEIAAVPLLKIAGCFCDIVIWVSEFVGNIHFLYIPLASVPAKAAALAAVIAAAVMLAIFRRADIAAFTTVCLFLLSVAAINIFRSVPSSDIEIAVLKNGNAAAVVIHDKNTADIIDLKGGGKAAPALVKYLNRNGIHRIGCLMINDGANTAFPVYSDYFSLFEVSASYIPEEFSSFAGIGCQDETVGLYEYGSAMEFEDYTVFFGSDESIALSCRGTDILFYSSDSDSAESKRYKAAVRYSGRKADADPDPDVLAVLDKNSETNVHNGQILYIGENIRLSVDASGELSSEIL